MAKITLTNSQRVSKDSEALVKKLKTLLYDTGVPKAEIAEILGCNTDAVYYQLRHPESMKIGTIIAIQQATGVEVLSL